MDLHTLITAFMAITGAVSAVGTLRSLVLANSQKPSALIVRVMVLVVCIGGVSYMLLPPAKSESQPSTVSAPLTAEAHYQKAKQYYDDHNRPQAIKEARQAVVLEPTHKDAHKLLGACYGMDQNMSAAASEYKEAAQIDPDDTEASLSLAVCLMRSAAAPRLKRHMAMSLATRRVRQVSAKGHTTVYRPSVAEQCGTDHALPPAPPAIAGAADAL